MVSFLFSTTSVIKLESPLFTELQINNPAEMEMNLDNMFGDLLEETPGSRFFYYRGSKTLPPCESSINWYVMETNWQISQEEYDILSAVINTKTGGYGNFK